MAAAFAPSAAQLLLSTARSHGSAELQDFLLEGLDVLGFLGDERVQQQVEGLLLPVAELQVGGRAHSRQPRRPLRQQGEAKADPPSQRFVARLPLLREPLPLAGGCAHGSGHRVGGRRREREQNRRTRDQIQSHLVQNQHADREAELPDAALHGKSGRQISASAATQTHQRLSGN